MQGSELTGETAVVGRSSRYSLCYIYEAAGAAWVTVTRAKEGGWLHYSAHGDRKLVTGSGVERV